MPIVSKTWSAGETLTHTDLNQNFSDIESRLGNLTNSDIATDAGIASTKLLDRFCPSYMTLVIGGHTGADNLVLGAANHLFPDTDSPTTPADMATNAFRVYPELPSGKRAYLCAISVAVHDYTVGSGPTATGRLWAYKNTTLLTGTYLDVDDEDVFYLRNADPFASPIIEMQDGDFLEFQLGRSATGGTAPEFGTINICVTLKVELVG